jgi:serine/threonine-protein kinase
MEIGGYRIEGLLGRGGMGVVYEATQLSLNRTVALKLLAAELGEDPSFRERFRREGRIQAGIDHAHIVTIFEAGELPEGLFIAMRLVRGPNLKQLIRSGELDPMRTIRVLTPVADALDIAHESGLIHRDVKPQNILVGRRDHAYLADFGLTKALGDTGVTRTGQLMGTLDYVAPEQIRGEPAEASSDIYAFAAVIYECLAGAPPFQRPSEAATLFAHMSEPPPRLSERRPDLPAAVDGWLTRALAKAPSDRPSTAFEMLTGLAEVLEGWMPQGNGIAAVVEPPTGHTPPSGTASLPRADTPVTPVPAEPEPAAAAPPGEVLATTPGGTELIAPVGTPTREDLRREWSPPPPEEPVPAEPRKRGRLRRGSKPARKRPAPPAREAKPVAAPAREATPLPPREATPLPPREATPLPAAAEESPPREPAPAAATASSTGRTPGRVLALAAGGVLVAALAGVLIGHSSQAEPPAPPQKVSGAKVGFTAPAGWRRASAPAVPGLDLDGAVAVADPETPGSTIVAGIADGSGSRLLPTAFERQLPDAPKTDDPVRLGRLQAYRYRKLAPRGGPPLTVYASPLARDGVVTVACLGAAAGEDCDRAASTLALRSGLRPRPLGPAREYGRAIGAAIDRLGRQRRSAQRALAGAKTSKGQAPRAKDVADTYDKAADAVKNAPAGPLEARANASLRTALLRARDAYRDLSSAADKRHKAAYSAARNRARRADEDARKAVAELDALGYEVD